MLFKKLMVSGRRESELISMGQLNILDGDSIDIDLTGKRFVSGRVRISGWSASSTSSVTNTSGNYSNVTTTLQTNVPSHSSGTSSSAFGGVRNVGDYDVQADIRLIAHFENGTYDNTVQRVVSPGQYFTMSSGSHDYSPGAQVQFRVVNGNNLAPYMNARTRYPTTTRSRDAVIEFPNQTITRSGNFGNSYGDWQNITDLKSWQNNSISFSVGGSNRMRVEIEYTVI